MAKNGKEQEKGGDREARIAELEAELRKKDAQLAEVLAPFVSPEEPEPTKEEKKLIAEGCEAYGIAEKYLLKGRVEYDGDEPVAVLVTHGGAKVRYRAGDKVLALDAVQVDGISRMKPRKPLTGGKKA